MVGRSVVPTREWRAFFRRLLWVRFMTKSEVKMFLSKRVAAITIFLFLVAICAVVAYIRSGGLIARKKPSHAETLIAGWFGSRECSPIFENAEEPTQRRVQRPGVGRSGLIQAAL